MVALAAKTSGFVGLCLGMTAFSVACAPDIEGGASIIASPRVLAVRSLPAEVEPNKAVAWDALFVGVEGALDPRELSWAVCTERKPIAVAGPVALNCLEPSGDSLVQVGTGAEVEGTIPKDACRIFGPSPPAPKAGEPTPRPADPDSRGGYFQPVRIRIGKSGDDYAVGLTRVSCGVAGATVEQSLDYAKRYRPNENPLLENVVLEPDGSALPLGQEEASAPSVAPSSVVTLRASWPDCPVTSSCGDGICGASEDRANCAEDCQVPHGCSGSEPYVNLDPLQRKLVDRRESLRVSWFSPQGTFAHDVSGRPEDEADTRYTDNDWTAPAEAGLFTLWVVLRDDRGGVGFATYFVRVE
jgi:hypothetical protein